MKFSADEENTLSPIVITLAGIYTLSRFSQYSNARSPIAVTEAGMIMLSIEEQFWNAFAPIVSSLFPKVTFLRL